MLGWPSWPGAVPGPAPFNLNGVLYHLHDFISSLGFVYGGDDQGPSSFDMFDPFEGEAHVFLKSDFTQSTVDTNDRKILLSGFGPHSGFGFLFKRTIRINDVLLGEWQQIETSTYHDNNFLLWSLVLAHHIKIKIFVAEVWNKTVKLLNN